MHYNMHNARHRTDFCQYTKLNLEERTNLQFNRQKILPETKSKITEMPNNFLILQLQQFMLPTIITNLKSWCCQEYKLTSKGAQILKHQLQKKKIKSPINNSSEETTNTCTPIYLGHYLKAFPSPSSPLLFILFLTY